MSRDACADARSARLRPASKSGCSSCGANVQPQEPPLNRPDSSRAGRADACRQRDAREERRARRADVGVGGAPAAARPARTSGRRTSTSDGRPAGTSAATRCRAVDAPARQVGRQRLADQQRQRVAGRARAGAAAAPASRARRLDQRLRLAQVELRRGAVVEAQPRQAQRLLARRQRLRA